ncbi:MAG: hypothetical protein M1827_005502 [Pycnora praestabilis]|nr:MAG: hypothetical protein M1827_005502 [Pycnora praestabilis]
MTTNTTITTLPSPSQLASIAAKQEEKERIRAAQYNDVSGGADGHEHREEEHGVEEREAAGRIQAVKEAQYRNLTRPVSRRARARSTAATAIPPSPPSSNSASSALQRSDSSARQNWRRVGKIALRAGSSDSRSSDSDHIHSPSEHLSAEQRQRLHDQKVAAKKERDKSAKMMDLQYFLEMVDLKHRYGSNLRAYHAEWQRSSTHENFFYWLDHGEGRTADLPMCPREKLERMQIRYLSREERMDYLVKIDKQGRLCWAKNGARIDTSEKWKDSIHGIVPVGDDTPAFEHVPIEEEVPQRRRSSSSDASSISSSSGVELEKHQEHEQGQHCANEDSKQSKGLKMIKHVSATTIFDRLLSKTVANAPETTKVADTSFRLYVGIKQSGSFQHSSFLHGGRISAAGLIKIKDGQLRSLSPLSGHYRPPSSNFRDFIHSLKEEGVDMGKISVSKSYAVLIGLETYGKTRKKLQHATDALTHRKEKNVHPEKVAKVEEEQLDHSPSALREGDLMQQHGQDQLQEKRHSSLDGLVQKLRMRSSSSAKRKKS